MAISKPRNPLAAHIGNGTIVIQFDPPTTGSVLRYEVLSSRTESGTYKQMTYGVLKNTRGYLSGFGSSGNLFLKVRAVSTTGEKSETEQVKAGSLQRPVQRFLCRSIAGSSIPQSAIFTSTDATGRLIAIQAQEDITIE